MSKGKHVNIHLKCEETVFSNYSDLTSKDGHMYIKEKGFRHYLICEIPRIIFVSYDSVREEIHVKIQKNVSEFVGKVIKIKSGAVEFAEGENEGVATKISKIEETTYPEIKVICESGNYSLFSNTYEFLCHVLEAGNEILTHTILYIGQTEVTEKYLRLVKHEKFVQVAEKYLSSKPNMQLEVKLFKFEQPECMNLKGEKLKGKVEKVIGKFTTNQITNLTEAALINAYKPKFNVHFVHNFPNQKHAHYNFIYNKGIDTLTLEVNENLRAYSLELDGSESNNQIFGWYLHGNPKIEFQDIFITNM